MFPAVVCSGGELFQLLLENPETGAPIYFSAASQALNRASYSLNTARV